MGLVGRYILLLGRTEMAGYNGVWEVVERTAI